MMFQKENITKQKKPKVQAELNQSQSQNVTLRHQKINVLHKEDQIIIVKTTFIVNPNLIPKLLVK